MSDMLNGKPRKIIHIDMDCFYASVEIRENPALADKPVAVGGRAEQRGVLSTCNYIARQFGLHSAMPTAQALKLCPNLVLLPVNMPLTALPTAAEKSVIWEAVWVWFRSAFSCNP